MKHLQNGSDIRGIAIQTDKHDKNLSPDTVSQIGQGFLSFLFGKYKKEEFKIAVGYDSRLTGRGLATALMASFTENCVQVIDCGLATTPAMFMTTVFTDYAADAAVMITASHLPYYYNGLKFFTKEGGLERQDISKIILHSELQNPLPDAPDPAFTVKKPLLYDYSAHIRAKILAFTGETDEDAKPLSGFKIVVDAGNGSGGFFADKVLAPLGADTTGSQFLDPDGNFPNHVPNPENAEAMESITKAVLANKADLGIIFDTDVDRAALVSADGAAVNRNHLIALISAILLGETPGATIVTDSVTSIGLAKFIREKGGKHHRFQRGYRNVIGEAIRLAEEASENAILAIETSGHAALAENYWLDDGAYLIARILGEAAKLHGEGRVLTDLINGLEVPRSEMEIRLKIAEPDFRAYGNKVLTELVDFVTATNGLTLESPNFEGVRVNCDERTGNGWFLLRLSLHEPVMPLNLESEEADGIQKMRCILEGFFAGQEGLSF